MDKHLIVMLAILTADGNLVTAYGDLKTLQDAKAEAVHAALEECLADLLIPKEKVKFRQAKLYTGVILASF